MRLRIFQVAVSNSYHIHLAACEGCAAEPQGVSEVGHPEGEAFASQGAIFLHLWGPEILARQVQSEDLWRANNVQAIVRDITDLWVHTVFMPCTEGLPKASRQDLEILVT